MLSEKEKLNLEIFAAEIRKETVKCISSLGAGHIGGAMSMVEALAVLYGKALNIDPKNPDMENRDRFVLSKGHAGPSLYATLALKGYFPMEQLYTLNKPKTILPSHCDRNKTPGIDYSTGSLGQGISLALGCAVGAKYFKKDFITYCIIGDGECDEGQVWEAVMFAGHRNMDNLIVFVDCNKQQLDGYTRDICNLGELDKKFEGFGWHAQAVDGHDVRAISEAVENAQNEKGKPSVIVLNTEKGHGFRPVEGKICHAGPLPADVCLSECEHYDKLISNLREKEAAI